MHTIEPIFCRKKDLVIRIADWTRDKDEPAIDVEVYIRGIYRPAESHSFCTKHANRVPKTAKKLAIRFAQNQVAKHLT